MGLIQWQSLQNIAAHWNTSIVRLSADSCSFLIACSSVMQYRSLWEQDDAQPVTDAQWDDIEALTAKAYTELMSDVGVGTIFPCVLAAVPAGALACDGSTHLRTDWPILYSVLDAAFIVDADHFTVPDLRGRTIIGVGAGTSTYAMNNQGGQETHTLTTGELAAHTHAVTDPGHNHTLNDPTHVHVLTDPGHIHALADPLHSHTIFDPGHGHSINNPTHVHGLTDPGHIHTVTDPGHAHTGARAATNQLVADGTVKTVPTAAATSTGNNTTGVSVDSHTTGMSVNAAAANQTINNASTGIPGTGSSSTGASVSSHTTGITEAAAAAGQTANSNTTGVSNANAGGGAAHENRQPYTALRYCIWGI